MQKSPLLLSPAKIGVIHSSPRLSWSRLILAIVCGFFVLYGALDIASRIFSLDAAPSTDTQWQYEQIPEAHAQVPAQQIQPITPERVRIPALGINAAVEQVGQNAGGHMAAPKHFDTVAWYKLGSKPGEAGNAVIAGHLNNNLGLSGVFERLGELTLGSEIIVEGEGKTIRYILREVHVYDADSAPASAIFSNSGPSRLILITCDGAWDSGVRSYDKRLVLVAEPL